MRGIIRLLLVILIWTLGSVLTDLFVDPGWHTFFGYLIGTLNGIIIMVD